MRIASAAVVVAALCGLGAPAFAHGGQYRGPTGQSPGGAPTPGTGGSGATPTTDWEAWWTANAWRFINLRERLRARDQGPEGTSTGGLGAHAGVQDGGTPEVRKDPREYFEKDVLPVLTEALEDQDAEVRSAAVVALGKLGFARSLHPLRKAMKDSVRDVRDGAVVALGMLGVPFVAEDLRAVLFDPKEPERTRSFAGIGLGLIGGEEGARPLMEYLDPASDGTREGGIHRTAHTEASALTGLGMSRFQAAIAPVRKDYDSGNRFEPTVRSFAAVALGRLGDHEAIPSLLLGLEFPREAMRQSAALALGMVATPADDAVVAALSKVLYQETDANTRQFALMSLARIGGDPARAAVRKYLEKGARIDIPLAALGCALGKDAAALPAVRKLYQEEKQPSVKGALALALGLYGDITVADELRRLSVAQGDRGLRIHCLTALGLMGDNASAGPALELLEKPASGS